MGTFEQSITVARSSADVARVLADLSALPDWVPNHWRTLEPLTRTRAGKGARASLLFNALGMWLPAEVEITESSPQRVRWSMAATPVELLIVWELTAQGPGQTQVALQASWRRMSLPPWRVRTHVRLLLRMDRDLSEICALLLSQFEKAGAPLATPQAATAGTGLPTEASADGFVAVAWLKDVPPGRSHRVRAQGRDVAVFHLEQGLFAIDNDCPHRQGPLSQGGVEGTVVTCPLHRWRFDVTTGESVSHPGTHVRTVPVRAASDIVWMSL